MEILILGLNHQIQPSEIRSSGENLERVEREQKNGFTNLLKGLIESHRVQFIGEQVEHGVASIASLIARERGCLYANIEMSLDERHQRNIPLDYSGLQPEYTPEQRAQWSRELEQYIVRKVLAIKGDANSALILCGREHTDPLAVLLRRAGNAVETSDLNREPWYIEDWLKDDRRSGKERRKTPRYMFTSTAEITEVLSGSMVKTRTSDLGAGGCFVDTPSPSPEGTAVRLRLTRDKKSFEARAKVVCSLAGSGMGLVFTDVKPGHWEVLENWIGELSGEPRSVSEGEGWEQHEQAPIEVALKEKQQYVLNELIIALMRNGGLTEEQGQAMLRKLLL